MTPDTLELLGRLDTIELLILDLLKLEKRTMTQLDDLTTKIDALGTALAAERASTQKLLDGTAALRADLAAVHADTSNTVDLSAALAKIDAMTADVKAETAKQDEALTAAASPALAAPTVAVTPAAPVVDTMPPVPAADTDVIATPVIPSPVAVDPVVPTAQDTATANTAAAAAIPVGLIPVTDEQKAQASPSIDSGATVLHDVNDTSPLAPVATTVPGGDGTTAP